MFLRFTSKQTYRINFNCSCLFFCNTPQFKRLAFTFQREIWIAQNFNFIVFELFCLSLSWKYRFSQNVNHAKVQSKNNEWCKFHVDLTRRRLSKSRFKKSGMVPKKLYRNTLTSLIMPVGITGKFGPEYWPITACVIYLQALAI